MRHPRCLPELKTLTKLVETKQLFLYHLNIRNYVNGAVSSDPLNLKAGDDLQTLYCFDDVTETMEVS